MYYTATKIPEANSSNWRESSPGLQRVHASSDRDGKKLSPVDLSIGNASTIQLPPLTWNHYHLTPSTMTVRNSGFTVMINATYDQVIPYVSSGPLMGDYIFSQIHFHWGEHNETGSGHAVDGIRYPLEMHVVHLKKECSNMSDAFKSKDGIAVMVHLFALREERNTQLDQLTAILQFIQKSKCCARLYPTPLSEIVHPFSSDYFLYWGGVGSPKGQYRILWLVSRNVLPISTQQLEEFRQLRDPRGKVLVTNSSKPHPLGGRSLFLVSPSERTNKTMYGIPRTPAQSTMTLESDDSVNIRNAEYNSLADLESVDINSCRICSLPKQVHHIANVNVGYPFRINEGDTSVEESCIDLGNNIDDPRVTVKTEMKYRQNPKGQKLVTNVNVTTCRHRFRPKHTPSETVYSVVSARGSELHLKRKALIVRQNDPSTEQACMLLSNSLSIRPTYSAPSLTTSGGLLTPKQERTDLSNPPIRHLSSEMFVHNIGSDHGPIGESELDVNEVEKETTFEEILKSSKTAKKVRIKEYDNVYIPFEKRPNINSQLETRTGNSKSPDLPKQDTKVNSKLPSFGEKEYDKFYKEGVVDEITQKKEQTKYVLVKQIKDKHPFYKVIGELPSDNITLSQKTDITKSMNNSIHKNNYVDNSSIIKKQSQKTAEYGDQNKKRTVKAEDSLMPVDRPEPGNDPNHGNPKKQFYREIHEKESFAEEEQKSSKEFYSKKNGPFCFPSMEVKKNQVEDKQTQSTNKPKKKVPVTDHRRECDPRYVVSLKVRTTVSDHRQPGKRKAGAAQQYFVTKILPVEKPSYISHNTPKHSYLDEHKCQDKNSSTNDSGQLYYARPINKGQQKYMENDSSLKNQRQYNAVEQGLTSEYYKTSLEESSQKEHRKETRVSVRTNEEDEYKIRKGQVDPHELHSCKSGISQNYLTQDLKLKEKNICNEESYKNEGNEFHQKGVDDEGIINRKSRTNLQGKDVTQSLTLNSSKAIYKENLKDKNLVVNTNVYHRKNDPDEDNYVVDKTITGKMGESQSTEGFVKNVYIEATSPNEIDVTKEINYNLVKSKHPEPQHYIKEPVDKSQPTVVIHQNLSLDQQIKGRSEIRQTVEYHNKTRSDMNKSEHQLPERKHEQKEKNKFSNKTETFEESSHEESSTFQKFQQKTQYLPSLQTTELDPKGRVELHASNKELENQKIQKEKCELLKLGAIDPKSMIPKAHTNSKLEQPHQELESTIKCIAKDHSKINALKTIEQNRNEINYPETRSKKSDCVDAPLNTTINYEYEESTSENKTLERLHHKKTLKYGKGGIQSFNSEEPLESKKSLVKYVPLKQSTQTLKQSTQIDTLPSVTEQQIKERGGNSVIDSRVIEDDDYEGVEIEEVFEENIHTSQITKAKKISTRARGETSYKFPRQDLCEVNQPLSKQAITIKKVEIPEPNYVTRIPKQPLVEYEAYHVDPHQPFEIITETSKEVSSVVKTNKTFMMFKKINGKAVLNQPSIIEPMRMEMKTSKDKPLSPDPSFKAKSTTTSIKSPSSADKDVAGIKIRTSEKNLLPLKTDTTYPRTEHYIDENYYESVTKSQKHESTKKQFVAVRAKAVEEDQLQPGPSHQYVSHRFDPQQRNTTSKEPKEQEIDYEPTRDITMIGTGASEIEEDGRFKIESMNENFNKNKQKSQSHSHQYALERGLPNPNGNIPITKTDGDIVIYIRQPRARKEQVSPNITLDVTDFHKMTQSELENQKVQVRELRPEPKKTHPTRKPIVPRRSKSAEFYNQWHSSETSDYDLRDNSNSDSNEEQIIDTTHYNFALKSKTEVELPHNQSAHVKSKAELKIKPLNKPNTPSKLKTAQEPKSAVDDCCSAHGLPDHGYHDQTSSLDEEREETSGEEKYSSLNQSPIEIKTKSSTVKNYPKLFFFNHWNAQGDALLENNGKTLRGSLVESELLPFLRGGPLQDDYIFYELHFHWGHKDCCGAEHIIDGQRNTLEAHYMYIKKGYESLVIAMSHVDGLVMVAVNLTVGGPPNPLLADLLKDMPLLREADTGAYVSALSLFSWIKPAIKSARGYFSYKGSLTGDASAVECVTWIIFPEPIIFCCQQSCEFRKLKSTKGELLKMNFRPPQPLNNRPVYYVPLTY